MFGIQLISERGRMSKKKNRRKGRKASKRTVICTMCTTHRWKGNTECLDGRWNINTLKRKDSAKDQIKQYEKGQL